MTLDPVHSAEMQRYVAVVAITPSALRNLGAKGFVGTAQKFLGGIDLEPLVHMGPSEYPGWLDSRSAELMEAFPIEQRWGPARKCVNIFMVMAALNRFLCAAYALEHLEGVFEVPLDTRVAIRVLKWAKRKSPPSGELPVWRSIKKLDKENSEMFQKLASEIAKEQGIPRGHLDVAFWPPGDDQ